MGDQGAVASHRRFGLAEGVFVGARIDDEQQVALVDVLSFGEAHLVELAGDLRLDLHDRGGIHRADHPQFGGHGFLRDLGDGHGNDRRPARHAVRLLLLAADQRQGKASGK